MDFRFLAALGMTGSWFGDHNYNSALPSPDSSPAGGEIQRGGGSGQTACFFSFEMNFLRNFDTLGRTTTKQYGWNGFFSKYCWWYSSAS